MMLLLNSVFQAFMKGNIVTMKLNYVNVVTMKLNYVNTQDVINKGK